MPRFVFEGEFPPYVTDRYPELAVRMKCRLCKKHVDVGFKCGCSGRMAPMPDISGVQFALDGIRTQVLIALKAACKNPVSTECCAKAPCSYADFLRLFLVMPDLCNHAAAASRPPFGLTYRPAAAHNTDVPWERARAWTERAHEVEIKEENAALRLLDLKLASAESLSKQAWQSLFVHEKNGTACGAVVPLLFAHHTNRKSGVGDVLSVTFSTFKVDGAQGSRMPDAMSRDIRDGVVQCKWLTSFWDECKVDGMQHARKKKNARKKMKMMEKTEISSKAESGGAANGGGYGKNKALGLPSAQDEAY